MLLLLRHLKRVFGKMNDIYVSCAPKKAFIGVSSVKLLRQMVDAF